MNYILRSVEVRIIFFFCVIEPVPGCRGIHGCVVLYLDEVVETVDERFGTCVLMCVLILLQLIFSIIAFAVVAEYDGWSKINYMVGVLTRS